MFLSWKVDLWGAFCEKYFGQQKDIDSVDDKLQEAFQNNKKDEINDDLFFVLKKDKTLLGPFKSESEARRNS